MIRTLKFKKRHLDAVAAACDQLSLPPPALVKKSKGRRQQVIVETRISADDSQFLRLALPPETMPIGGW
jgi:hypothetical protein